MFVAFAHDVLNITCELKIPANQSHDILTCSDPFNRQIYNFDVPATTREELNLKTTLELKKLNSSGEYSCRYKTAKVYWFLRVRGENKRRESEWKLHLAVTGFAVFQFCVIFKLESLLETLTDVYTNHINDDFL